MSAFTTESGKIALYLEDHVDTDRIIPARFLTMVTRSGYGELLFNDVRGPEFPLDQPDAKGAKFLVVGTNFGCGSSREHAVWAIQQAGFHAVISRIGDETRGFGDIFRQNSANCGLLLIELGADDHARLSSAGMGALVTIDLPQQMITWEGGSASFEIGAAIKKQVMEGLDLIGLTLSQAEEIDNFEQKWDSFRPVGVPTEG